MSAVGRLAAEIEALLFTSAHPVPARELKAVIGAKTADIAQAIAELTAEYSSAGHGFEVCEVAGGYLLRSRAEFGESIRKFHKARPARLSRPALETLAVVAYRQPITRPEIEQLRGVDCGAVMKSLLDHRLVKIIGRKDEIGRPLLWGTTKEFLEFFGLRDLTALPTLREFAEINDRAVGEAEEGDEEKIERKDAGTQREDASVLAPSRLGGLALNPDADAEAGAGADAEADGVARVNRG